MFVDFVNEIKEGNTLIINNIEYNVHSKVFYTTRNDSSANYIKLKLDNNKCFVIIPSDEMVYIGEVIDNMNYTELDNNTILYNNKKYEKAVSDYQIVRKVEFGDEYEKECSFTDYMGVDDNTIISLAILTENNKRADVFATILDYKDIKIK